MSSTPFDLSHLPPTFLLPTRLSQPRANEISSQLRSCKCPLTSNPIDASLFVGDINMPKRCEFELRGRGLSVSSKVSPVAKKVRVVKLKWFTESYENSKLLPIDEYIVFTGYVQPSKRPSPPSSPKQNEKQKSALEKDAADRQLRKEILERAKRDKVRYTEKKEHDIRDDIRKLQDMELLYATGRQRKGINELIAISKSDSKNSTRQSTPEYEEQHENIVSRGRPRLLKEMPDWVQQHNKYSCCRPTPLISPNAEFISLLKIIKLSRVLTSDGVGIRAYSTAIATLQAYPYPLISPSEVSLLPGCDGKSSALFQEYINSRDHSLAVVRELEKSPSFNTLKLFCSIWGVGPAGAREFFYDKGWKTLEDIVDHGWSQLTRAQQIGVKYFDEFQSPISRNEAREIAAIVGKAAGKLRAGMDYTIVGGYRRGKMEIHDVDILLSHTTHSMTTGGVIKELVSELEASGHITHTLHLGRELNNTTTVNAHRYGFDSLEKALVVFLSPSSGQHRRVDIILAPPVSVGSALLGWTGGTTFERDLRLWCDKEHKWKFTSEGVFERITGRRVAGVDGTWRVGEKMVEVERRLMEGMGLKWLEPCERCTG
ncbi:Nucleotidyltransferase [Choiromyces venosus 120613-1]|uniref:DNA polymerase n=1 Tax=Choiromyces venosus 120613-1 TaxID=1336337 RepID=A0A3N4J4U1_9PEZI|nr:Nucleotidyltransferase [Choiromyces venosus 120613-1]